MRASTMRGTAVRRAMRAFSCGCAALIGCFSLSTHADNAGFALAPKDAVFALDARGVADLLEGDRGAVVRPILDAFAGADARATFDLLAKRAKAPSELLAQDLFAGRIAFLLPGGTEDGSWLLGFESDDQRCAHLLRMLGGKMTVPGRFESATELLAMRRVGGWLLIAPATAHGRALMDASALRVPKEDPAGSLIGEPLMQGLLADDASVRVFMRHSAPMGGATTIALRGEKRGLHAEITGSYDTPPVDLTPDPRPLDAHLMRALEEHAVLAIAHPADGLPRKADGFLMALLPELKPPPAMRANLSGERVFLLGMSNDHQRPTFACAWRIEDPEQGELEQDHFMRGVSCSIQQLVAVPRSDQRRADPQQAKEIEPAANHSARVCAELGLAADRYLGAAVKLGHCQLCWKTVPTPCGGWQVYASDPQWLTRVSERLSDSSCSEDEHPKVDGLGFCDGPRAATLLRRWQPLVVEGKQDRVSRGLSALSDLLERMGRVRFRYDLPTNLRVHALVDIESPGHLETKPAAHNRDGVPAAAVGDLEPRSAPH